MVQTVQCPQCGANHSPDDSPEGLCPKRLLAIAMGGDQADATLEGYEDASGRAEIGRQALDKLIGQVLDGKYRLDEKLGQGGMGAVYKATHLGTGRPVALKVIAPQFMHNEEFVERFKREAKAAGLLRHPNVVNVTDFGFATAGGDRLAYLVMEYLDGGTLGHMLRRKGKLGLEFVVDIVEQAALAIDEAHKQGIIHRDLKPDNIWLEPNGRGGYNVKVLDFGLAKLREGSLSSASGSRAIMGISGQYSISAVTAIQPQAVDQDAPTEIRPAAVEERTLVEEVKTEAANRGATAGAIDPRTVPEWLTRAGAVLGTPLYMSPEQCRGEALDARSDIYSLGVIVYEMLAGETPFAGDLYRLIAKHSETPPPSLRKKQRDIPKSVAALVMSALAKNPSERPATANSFATAMRTYVEGLKPISHAAYELVYRKHFAFSMLLSLFVYTPFLLLNSLLLFLVTQLPLIVPPSAFLSIINNGIWPIMLLVILFANQVNTAAWTLIIEQSLMSRSDRIQIRPILWTLIKQFPQLLIASIINIFTILLNLMKFVVPGLKSFVDDSLYASVVIIENKRGKAALKRSHELARHLRSLTIRNQADDLFSSLISIFVLHLGFYIMSLLTVLILEGDSYIIGREYTGYFLLIRAGLVAFSVFYIYFSLLWIVLVHPLNSAKTALLYFKARQSSSERMDESFRLTTKPFGSIEPSKTSYFNKLEKLGYEANRILYYPAAILLALFFVSTQYNNPVSDFSILNRENSSDALKSLLASGLDINSKTMFGNTVLINAAYRGDAKMVRLLLTNGAGVNIKNGFGSTALMSAAYRGHSSIVKELIAAGADVNAKSDNDNTALMSAAYLGHSGIVKELIAAGADVNAKNNNGNTALMYASRRGNSDTVKILLAAGTDINVQNKDGDSALTQSVRQGNIDSLRALLAAGADVKAQNRQGGTALILAADKGYAELVKELLAAGAEFNAKNNEGKTALTYAIENDFSDIIEMLKAAGAVQ